MCVEGFSPPLLLIQRFGAMLAAGCAVKLMDDFLDEPEMSGRGAVAWLGWSVFPYGLVSLLLGLILDRPLAAALFLSCYAVGMGQELQRRTPLGIPSWLESGLALVLSYFAAGSLMVWSLAAVLAVQLLDDMLDEAEDRMQGRRSFVVVFGKGECVILLLVFSYWAVLWCPFLSGLMAVSYFSLNGLFYHLQQRANAGGGCDGSVYGHR